MKDNQKSDDDGGPRPPDRSATPPPSAAGTASTIASTMAPGAGQPARSGGAIGGAPLTANVVPWVPPPAALRDPGERAQAITTASQQLQDAGTQLDQAERQVIVRRASVASTSSTSSTSSSASLDRYEQEVQILRARIVQLQYERPQVVQIPRLAPAPARAPSPDPSEPASEPAVEPTQPAAGPGFDYDWLKRAAKASSYGLQLAGAAVSMLGWAAFAHLPRVQQVGQTSGSAGKSFAGAVGDFADYQDKTGKGENADGLLLKSGGQAISGAGQVISLAGIVASNGTVLRATGAFINAVGMVVTGVGELQPEGEKKNVAKAATNFVGAAFAVLGGVGFAIEHDAVGKVLEEVARSFEAAGSASSAFTPFGGAADDAKNSKAAGDTKRARLLADPKPGGQAIAAIGGVMNTAALMLNKLADEAKTPDEAMKMKLAARVLGSVGSMVQSVGAGFTADGEWRPRKAPPRPDDPERGHELATLAPASV